MKKGIITNNKIKYKYLLLNFSNFVKLIQTNKYIQISIEKILSDHRNENDFNIITLINEAYIEEKNNKKTYYFFIYKDNEIITSCRLIVDNKNNAYINMVHTNINYRGQGLCKKNISKLIQLTNDKIKKYILDVNKKNINAINCYLSIGFTFSKINKKSEDHKMFFKNNI